MAKPSIKRYSVVVYHCTPDEPWTVLGVYGLDYIQTGVDTLLKWQARITPIVPHGVRLLAKIFDSLGCVVYTKEVIGGRNET